MNDDCLADAGATEEADLSAFQEWLDQVNDFYAGLEHLGGCGLLVKQRSRAVNGHLFVCCDGAEFIHRLADHIHHSSKRAVAHGHGNGSAHIDRLHAAHHAFGGLHGDAAYAAFAQMLLHFENHV